MKDDETHPDSSEPREQNSIDKVGWIGFVVILLLWGMYWKWIAPLFSNNQFDPFNALFSGMAFWGLIFAILLQRHELSLQRRELRLTRSEVRGQKEQLETQNVTMKRQRFENTFFSLLDLFSKMVNSMEIPLGMGSDTKGRDCFSRFCYEFGQAYTQVCQRYSGGDKRNECKEAFASLYAARQSHVDHYFRTLYHIVRYVDSSEVEDKSVYINFLKVQLSSSELKLLFYNCLSDMGSTKFKTLIQKHGLLDNLRKEILLDQNHLSLL